MNHNWFVIISVNGQFVSQDWPHTVNVLYPPSSQRQQKVAPCCRNEQFAASSTDVPRQKYYRYLENAILTKTRCLDCPNLPKEQAHV